jgi:hypothetical protein
MAFWSSPDLEPTRKYRFKVKFNGDVVWWAKSVSKPSFEVSSNKYTAINYSLEYPGIVSWNDITLTVVDVGKKTKEYYSELENMGYVFPTSDTAGGVMKVESSDALIIEQVDADGKTIEKWALKNFMIKSVTFGDLSYDDDGLVELQLTIAYDWAELK